MPPQQFGGGHGAEIEETNKELGKLRANTIFMRKQSEKPPELSDFKIKSVIGKGSFGKVFLVQKDDTKGVFAMKSLRKDVILDYD